MSDSRSDAQYVPPFTGWSAQPEQQQMQQAPPPPEGSSQGDDDVTLTQSRLTAMMTSEKRQGRDAGKRELAESLGYKTVEEVETAVAALQKAERDREDAATRREREVAEKETAAADREAKAAARERTANRRLALVGLGATGANLADAEALLSAAVTDDADETALADAAKALAERRPELFATSQAARTPSTDSRTQAPPRQQTQQPAPGERGRAEAARRYPNRKTQ